MAIDKNTVIKNTSDPREIRRIFVVAVVDVDPGLGVSAKFSALGFLSIAWGRTH